VLSECWLLTPQTKQVDKLLHLHWPKACKCMLKKKSKHKQASDRQRSDCRTLSLLPPHLLELFQLGGQVAGAVAVPEEGDVAWAWAGCKQVQLTTCHGLAQPQQPY
jgi:hypothetical protein